MILGQLQKAQMDEIRQKSIMAEIERRYKEQEMRQKAEMHPYELQAKQAGIGQTQAQTGQIGAQTQGLNFNNRVRETRGVPAAVGDLNLDTQTKRFKLDRDTQGALMEDILTEEWSPNLKQRLDYIHQKHQTDQERAALNYGQINSKEVWDEYRRRMFESLPEIRKESLKAKFSKEQAESTATIQSEGRLEAARIRAEQAKYKATLEQDITRLRREAMQLRTKAQTATGSEKSNLLAQAQAAEAEANILAETYQRMRPEGTRPIDIEGINRVPRQSPAMAPNPVLAPQQMPPSSPYGAPPPNAVRPRQ